MLERLLLKSSLLLFIQCRVLDLPEHNINEAECFTLAYFDKWGILVARQDIGSLALL